MSLLSRRRFLVSSMSGSAVGVSSFIRGAEDATGEPIIDIHQHTDYRERTNAQLFRLS